MPEHLDQNKALVRDVETLEIQRTLTEVGVHRTLLELAVSAEGKYVAFGDVEIFIHDLTTGEEVARVPVDPPRCSAVSPSCRAATR